MATSHDKETIPEGAFRILITGFGPFNEFKVNPSWLAVKPLHNTTITADSDKAIPLSRPIHVTTLEVPTTYEYVLNTVPGFHARPPILPSDDSITPPDDGYDFILHVGVAPPGPLRVERQGHKYGYTEEDALGELAPIVVQRSTEQKGRSDDEVPLRGFAAGYETFPDLLATDIDVDRLVQDLQQSGTTIQISDDAGCYLCDFIYYCSLAESRRSLYRNPPDNKNNTTQVLFLHCCPVGQPFTTEDVTEGIKRIVIWVCNELQARDAKSPNLASPTPSNESVAFARSLYEHILPRASESNDAMITMQEMANQNNAMTMATMEMNMQMQMNEALSEVGDRGASSVEAARREM